MINTLQQSNEDTVAQKILTEYEILSTRFVTPVDFARFICLHVQKIRLRKSFGAILGISDTTGIQNTSETSDYAEFSQFLLSRARASGARSMMEVQKWYLDTLSELKNL